MIAITLSSTLASIQNNGSLIEMFKSLIILYYISLCSILIHEVFKTGPVYIRAKICYASLVIGAFFVFYAFLESKFGGLRDLSDTFRSALFDVEVGISDNRELLMSGGVRSRAFALEPAIGALGVCLLGSIAYFYANSKYLRAFCIFICLASSFAYSSPIGILFFLSLSIIYIIMYFRIISRSVSHLLFFVFALLAVSLSLSNHYKVRMVNIYSGNDASFKERIEFPLRLSKLALSENWAFGVGIGLESQLTERSKRYESIKNKDISRMINAPILAIVIYFGIFGILASLLVVTIIAQKFGIKSLVLFLVSIMPIMFSGANIHTSLVWAYSGIILASPVIQRRLI
jgi:hypothetical protein